MEDRDSFRDAVKNIGKMFSNHNKEVHHRISLRMIDQALQSYLRDAEYSFGLNVFIAHIKYRDCDYDKVHSKTYYFVNRMELSFSPKDHKGNESVYSKMKGIKGVLNAKTRAEVLNQNNASADYCPDSIDKIKNENDKASKGT